MTHGRGDRGPGRRGRRADRDHSERDHGRRTERGDAYRLMVAEDAKVAQRLTRHRVLCAPSASFALMGFGFFGR